MEYDYSYGTWVRRDLPRLRLRRLPLPCVCGTVALAFGPQLSRGLLGGLAAPAALCGSAGVVDSATRVESGCNGARFGREDADAGA